MIERANVHSLIVICASLFVFYSRVKLWEVSDTFCKRFLALCRAISWLKFKFALNDYKIISMGRKIYVFENN